MISEIKTSSQASDKKEILFHTTATRAKNVFLAADFTGWKKSPVKMIKGAGNLWHIRVTLPPGKYRYQFLVDIDLDTNPAQAKITPLPFGTLRVAEVVV